VIPNHDLITAMRQRVEELERRDGLPGVDIDLPGPRREHDDSAGHWRMAPAAGGPATRRRYRDDTLILETEWNTPEGAVRVIDYMPPRGNAADVVRRVALRTDVELHGANQTTVAEFTVRAGERIPFVLTCQESHLPRPNPVDAERARPTAIPTGPGLDQYVSSGGS
jgi:hypothetical protein